MKCLANLSCQIAQFYVSYPQIHTSAHSSLSHSNGQLLKPAPFGLTVVKINAYADITLKITAGGS